VTAPASQPASEVALTDLRVAPSILSANFAELGSEVQEVLAVGARVIHVDVMDGHFVPPISFGAVVVSALADLVHDAGGILDVHMMVERPERHVGDIAKAGADSITIHVEATAHVHYTLQSIHEAGCLASAAICPATPIEALSDVGPDMLDMALCMTVNPGWGAQSFIPHSLDKVSRLCALLPAFVGIEVDGGIHEQTAGPVVRAGANLLVAGSAVFNSDDPAATYERIAAAAGALSA
jgi:ribulose-phosphate 3-epimerase